MPSPNPATRRDHAGNAVATTLSGSMTNVVLSFTITANTDWPTGGVGPFFVVIDAGTGSEEKVLCASRSVLTITVAGSGRGVDGTAAVAHALGASVYPCWTAVEADEMNAHAAAVAAVHGATGAVVGTTGSQALTNKTINAANNTLSNIPQSAVPSLAAHVAATAAVHGAVGDVVGTTDAQTLTNKTINASGNTLSNIPQSAVTNLVADLAAKANTADITTHAALTTGVHGAGAGNVVGTTLSQTLTNKTINAANNTLSNIPESSVTNLVADLAAATPTDNGWISDNSKFATTGSGAWQIINIHYRQVGNMLHVLLRFQCLDASLTTATAINGLGSGQQLGTWSTALSPVLSDPANVNDFWECEYSGSVAGIEGVVRFFQVGSFSPRGVRLHTARQDIAIAQYIYITTCYPIV